MNHTLKFQLPSDFLRSVITRINIAGPTNVCGHCLKKHKNLEKGGRKFSTDATILRHFLKRKQSHQKISKKEKKNAKKAITELVEVSDFQSFKTTMKVHQLKANDVKAFANNPGMTFKKEKMNKSYSYNSVRSYDPSLIIPTENVIKFVESLIKKNDIPKNGDTNFISNNNNLQNAQCFSFLENNKKKNIALSPVDSVKFLTINKVLQPEYKEMASLPNVRLPVHEKPKDTKTNDKIKNFESKPKEINIADCNTSCSEQDFVKMLQAFIDVAITSGDSHEAFEIMKTSRNKKLWANGLKILKVTNVYNQMLYGFMDDWSKICEIREWMKADKVSGNHQTYAALLESLGKNKEKHIIDEAYWRNKTFEILKEMRLNALSINGLFTNTQLDYSQCQFILKSIHEIYPNFEIAPFKIKLNSDCILLNDLNEGHANLESFLPDNMSIQKLTKLIDQQIEVEKKFNIPVEAIKVQGVGLFTPAEKQKYQSWTAKWHDQLHNGFKQSCNRIDEMNKSFGIFNLSMFLKCLPTEMYVEAMMNAVKNLVEYSGGFSPTFRILQKNLGDQIHERYQIIKKEKYGITNNTKEIFKRYCDWYSNPHGPAKNSRQQWQLLCQEYCDGSIMNEKEVVWPESLKLAIGKFLYDIILKKVRININDGGKERTIPVFYSVIRQDYLTAIEEIKCHPSISRLFQKCGFDTINFEATEIPMVCPPKPWKSISFGGYLLLPVEFTRSTREFGQKKINFKKISCKQLYPNFDSLNSLQMVPWKINKPILDIVLNIFENGGCDNLSVPEYPNLNSMPINITPDMTDEQRLLEFRKKKVFMMDKQNKYGIWCEALYRLSLAKYFRNTVFWLPQNFDFRGRVYPVPPYLNHIGGDLFRSLLIFAKGKPLGPKGLDWLKIHAVNLTGTQKKASNQERLNYANQILPEILDSAERPLEGRRWWVKSEERWQTLAACMEIKKALECDNPHNYICYFPVHQDGSCNGLQHYAALGRDCVGAKSVNLTPCDKPQDVYNAVTQLIEIERAIDAENKNEIAQILEGFVRRKVVKQTIMTTVYGVTFFGAKLQIARQLEDISDFPKNYVNPAADYLVKKTFKCLKQMFTSAKEIQDWFIKCAGVICEQNDFVQWISPLGLPILQPYAKKPNQKTKNFREVMNKPNTLKQRNAFPPNFVHSLDSSHMMLTAMYCEQANITFASIHDCFWTHPCSIDAMNEICRKQFIALHSQSILKDLSNFFISHYVKNKEENSKALNIFSSVPQTGDFDLNEIYKSVYFFS